MNPIDTIEYRGFDIEVYVDECPPNPREEWNNFGTMACWSRNYLLGDNERIKRDRNPLRYYLDSPEAFSEYLNEREDEIAVILPLYLYDHSGLSISTDNSGYPFNCPWDSGQVGWIFCTKEDIRKEWSGKRVTKKRLGWARDILMSEVEIYDDYLSDNVLGYVIKKNGVELPDSCWGFYGDPEESGLLEAAQEYIDWYIEEETREEAVDFGRGA